MRSRQPHSVPPFCSPRGRLKESKGEGEGCQVCFSAPALNLPVSIVSKRRMRYLPTFPEPFWKCHGRALLAAQVVDETLSFSPLQPRPL